MILDDRHCDGEDQNGGKRGENSHRRFAFFLGDNFLGLGAEDAEGADFRERIKESGAVFVIP